MKTVTFKEWDCVVEESTYFDGRVALLLNDAKDGSRIAVATVNIPEVPIETDDIIFIKDYAENKGMLQVLTEAGIVTPTKEFVKSGHVKIPICIYHKV